MHKRLYKYLAIIVALLIILLAATYLRAEKQERLAARYHLLCEVLKPGMSEDQVLDVLYQQGEFTFNRGDWGQGSIVELGINFTDPKGKSLYSAFDLRFYNNRYDAAFIRGFESIDVICDFHNQINIPTAVSNP